MKLQFLSELSQQGKQLPVEFTPNVQDDFKQHSVESEENEENMQFLGTEPNSAEHIQMVATMKALKRSNPSLYHKILNFD